MKDFNVNINRKCFALLITNDFPPYFSGGISKFYFNLVKHTNDISLLVIAPWSSSARRHDQIHKIYVKRVPVPIGGSVIERTLQMVIFFFVALVESFKRNLKFLIIGHLYLSPVGTLLKLLKGIPYIIIFHGGETERYAKGVISSCLTHSLVKASDLIIANSNYTKDEIRNRLKYKKCIYVLNPGVDVESFYPQNINSNRNKNYVLLSVGTLVKRKGHENVLKAIAKIKEEIDCLKYIIIGKGPEMDNLKNLAYNELGLEDYVDFLGFVEDKKLPYYYNMCDVFIMPSMKIEDKFGTEGFGIVYLEANACGKPVIGGRSGGVTDAVIDGETGILVNPESVDEIAEAILFLYKNKHIAVAMGQKGMERARKEFTWLKVAERFQEIINKHFYSEK